MHHVAAGRPHHADHGGHQRLMLFDIFGIHQHRVGRAGMERQGNVVEHVTSGFAVVHRHMVERECRVRLEEECVLLAMMFDFAVDLR